MAHTADSTTHGSGHGHDDHDAHGHGHGGGQSLGYEIISETSKADSLLKSLAWFALAGLFVFAGIMIYGWSQHEGGEHSAPSHHAEGPSNDAAAETHAAPAEAPSNLSPGASHENTEHH